MPLWNYQIQLIIKVLKEVSKEEFPHKFKSLENQ